MDEVTLILGIPAFFTCLSTLFQVRIWYKLGTLEHCHNKDCMNYRRYEEK